MSRNDMQPGRETLYEPILNALKEHGPLHCRDRLPAMVADALGMSQEQREERYPPGSREDRTKHEKNVAFALTELKARGMADSDGRGNWRITESGDTYLENLETIESYINGGRTEPSFVVAAERMMKEQRL